MLNAKDYGIPQNRERVFTISIRKDIDLKYHFPDKEILDKNLQELLENNVEEKYFLSKKGIKYVLKRTGGYVQLIDSNTEIAHCPVTAKGNTNWTGNFVKFEFPPKEPLKLKLKDMLENEVDEKYFLKDVQIERIKATTYVSGGVRRIQQRRIFGHVMCKRLQRSEMYSSRKFKKTRLSRIFKQSIFRRRNRKNINVNRWRKFRQNRFIPCSKFKRRSLG